MERKLYPQCHTSAIPIPFSRSQVENEPRGEGEAGGEVEKLARGRCTLNWEASLSCLYIWWSLSQPRASSLFPSDCHHSLSLPSTLFSLSFHPCIVWIDARAQPPTESWVCQAGHSPLSLAGLAPSSSRQASPC